MFRKDRYPNWAPIVCEECSFYFENGDKWAKYTSGVCQVKPLSLQKSEKSRQVSVGHGQSYYLASEQGEELDDLLLFIPPLHLRKKKAFYFFSHQHHVICFVFFPAVMRMPAVLPARNFFSSYFSSGQSCFKAPSRLIQAVEIHELTVVGQVGSVKTGSGFTGAGHKD